MPHARVTNAAGLMTLDIQTDKLIVSYLKNGITLNAIDREGTVHFTLNRLEVEELLNAITHISPPILKQLDFIPR
jgi:hypothetical protein